MAEKLTKQAFEAGKPFTLDKAPEHGILRFSVVRHDTLRRYKQNTFFCLVENITERSFDYVYTFINEPFQGQVKFQDCTIYNPKKLK